MGLDQIKACCVGRQLLVSVGQWPSTRLPSLPLSGLLTWVAWTGEGRTSVSGRREKELCCSCQGTPQCLVYVMVSLHVRDALLSKTKARPRRETGMMATAL